MKNWGVKVPAKIYEDITEEIKWTVVKFSKGDYWLMGRYEEPVGTDGQFYFTNDGFHFNNEKYEKEFKHETHGSGFCILKKI